MTCPLLIDGRCTLAESHAKSGLGQSLECRPDSATCVSCLAAGPPEERLSIPCIGLVTRQLSAAHLPEWRAYVGYLRSGQERPAAAQQRQPRQGQRRKRQRTAATPRKRRPKPPKNVCVHKGREVDSFPCGCAGGGNRPISLCDVNGKCCDYADHVERVAEHLRRKFPTPDQKAERKFQACQGCKDYLPLVTLEASLT